MWDQGVDLARKPSLSCFSLDSCQTDMIHSPVEVVLLPQMISLIFFSYWLTAAFFKIESTYIVDTCKCAYTHTTHILCIIHPP